MPDPILPGYTWSPQESRYRSVQSGRFVSRSDITDLLRTQIQGAEARLHDLATAFHEQRISPVSFVEQMRTEQRRLTLQNVALGNGGFDNISQSSFGKAGASLRDTYAKIVGTAQDVVDGDVSLPQLLSRVDSYAGEARTQYYEAARDNAPDAPEGMTTIERRMLGYAMHCDDCLEYYAMGYQQAGTLPSPGESCQCAGHCRCDLVSRDVPTAELDTWIGTKG